MKLTIRCLALSIAMTVAFAGCASGQTAEPKPIASQVAPNGEAAGKDTLTGKERLGKKWSDEQRTDDCGVPPDLRGDKSRPDCEKTSR